MSGNGWKKWKNNEARRSFLPFVWEQREDIRGKLCMHSKPRHQSWTEVIAQQTLGTLENRSPSTSFTWSPNTITIPFCSLFRRKDIISVMFPISLLERHQLWERLEEMLQDWGFSPAEQVMFPWGAQCGQCRLPECPGRGVESLGLWCDVWSFFLGFGATRI